MSLGWVLTMVALLPLAAWGIAVAVVAVRRWLRRRGDERTRRLRLARMLGAADLVVVPTADVDLPETAVLEVASDAGMRLLGYERTDTPLRRRVGVFVRVGGEVDMVIRGDGGQARERDATTPR
ncbi:hypothetical protein [Dietzia sp. ANT_WB102]|uniref:hypothetical protein n=1 Tax=Dietzia sp. ANT_WB102 TaxID=2597345 RepID=UPI0011F08067|nr:hypothetical protein [Dietzia sp. ANT_WB102]KAA0917875.1 hypothetical protein FQ137_00175 [Dietzia sp. ANT_WB102]